MPGYTYYGQEAKTATPTDWVRRRTAAHSLGEERLAPIRRNPDYLILRHRKRILERFISTVSGAELTVLDVGGRIQPYRSLLGNRVALYVGVDPQLDGLVDVVAFGEDLPVAESSIDIVLCTQVLTYARHPEKLVGEIFRVLKPGGTALLSVPAFFPEHHDERWRFLPAGMEVLLENWLDVEILPEGNSLTGFLRTLNVCMVNMKSDLLRSLCERTLIPLLNMIGEWAEGTEPRGTMLTANYSMMARRPTK